MGWLRFVPFLGRLNECSGSDLKEAGTEVVVATIFSTMPLWLLPVLSAILFVHPVTGYEAIRTGELFLFSTALVGPLAYIISKNYGERHGDNAAKVPLLNYSIRFPYGPGFILACVAISLISSIAFIVLRNPFFSETDLSKVINYNGVIELSWGTFISATMLFFCATAYRNGLDNVVRVMPTQEQEFVKEWEERK